MSTVKDKATAFKNELAGSHTNKIICKAASHELAGPKKKHVDYLLQLTNNPRCQFTTLVDLISERLKHSSWVVVFKGLILCHNLMSLGNEKFLQCVATKGHMFDVDDFTDKSDPLATEMSSYLRKYARYIRHVCISYKALAMDICRIPKGVDSQFRNMEVTKLLKTATVIQDQLDILLEVEYTSSDLSNGVINTSFLMLYKDLIKIYTVYNDAVINLLEKFFEMKKSDCKETISYYRRFLIRQETIQKFLQLAEDVGVDKDTHLNLRQVPEDLLPALEAHLTDMDAIKKASGAQPSPQIQAASERLQELRGKDLQTPKTSTQSNSGAVHGFPSASQEVLEAQRKRFEELKKHASSGKLSPSASSTDSNTLTKSTASITAIAPPPQTATSPSGTIDLLGLDTSSSSNNSNSLPTNFSPWGSSGGIVANSIPPTQQATNSSYNPFGTSDSSSTTLGTGGGQSSTSVIDPWTGGGQPDGVTSSYQEVDLFSEIRGNPDFDNMFGGNKPQASSVGIGGGSLNQFSMMGDVLVPQAVGAQAPHFRVQGRSQGQSQQMIQSIGLSNDVESSLARAAANLSVDANASNSKTGMPKKSDHQWNAPKEAVKTGGPNWQKQNLQPKTLLPGESKAADWSGGMQVGHFSLNTTVPAPSMMAGGGMGMMAQRPMMMGSQQPMMRGGGMQQIPMGGMMMSGGMYQQQQTMMGQPFMQQQQQQPGGMQGAGMWPQQQQQQQFQQNSNTFGQNAPLF